MTREEELRQKVEHITRWRREHPEEHRARAAKYRETHREHIREYMRKYVAKNRAKIRESARLRGRIYHALDPSKRIAASTKWRKRNQQFAEARRRDFYRKHPERAIARARVYRAIKSGRLIRPDKCSNCGKQGKPEAHHPDYFKPLEVIWLCHSCHRKNHRRGCS